MGERVGELALARPIVFRPFTSAEPIASGSDTFSFKIPLLKDSGFVDPSLAAWPETRYVYIFATEALMSEANPLLRTLFGPGKNPLVLVCRVSSSGEHALAEGRDVKALGPQAAFTPLEEVPLPVDQASITKELEKFYALAVPELLSDAALQELEKQKPDALPFLGEELAILGSVNQSPINPKWVAPIVDPLFIAECLTKQYFAACDAYLAHTQAFQVPANSGQGDLTLLKKGVADTLAQLKKHHQLEGVRAGEPEKFLKDYEKKSEQLTEAREEAAVRLLRWLTGDVMQSVEGWYRESSGKPTVGYKHCVRVFSNALSRLGESDTGTAYLSLSLNESKKNQGKPGILRFIDEFVLPDKRHSDEHMRTTFATADQIVSAWSAFFAVLDAHVAAGTMNTVIVDTKTVVVSTLKDSSVIMLRRWQLWLDDDLNQFPKKEMAEIQWEESVPVKIPVKVEKTTVNVTIIEPRIKLSPAAIRAMDHLGMATQRVTSIVDLLNVGLTFCAMREALRKEGNLDDKVFSSLDFAGALLDLSQTAVESSALQTLRARLTASGAQSAQGMGTKAIVGRLGLLGSMISLAGASRDVMGSYEKGDWGSVAGNVAQGVGAALTGAGFVLMAASPKSGGLVGYFLLGGAVVSLVGFLWVEIAEDLPLDRLSKFCAFGERAGQADKADGWMLCPSGQLSDWNPNTPAGLQIQLRAFEQLFFSFQASGVDGEPDTLRLYPSAVREDSVFHINYTARYFTDLPKDVPESDPRRSGLQIVGHCTVHLSNMSLVTVEGDPLETENVVSRKKIGGKDVIDVRFVPSIDGPKADLIPRFPGKDSLICRVRLAPYGDGGKYGSQGVLAVPSNAAGARRLEALLLEETNPVFDIVSSTVDDDVV